MRERHGYRDMTIVQFYEEAPEKALKYVVILAKQGGKWIFCKHRERDTLEIPGGHIEAGETAEEAARRELYEETGATEYEIIPVCVYSVTRPEEAAGGESFGKLYYADVKTMEEELHSEIEKIFVTERLPDRWTYPDIQPKLMEEAARRNIF